MKKGICKNFNGYFRQGMTECDAGINYRKQVGGDDNGWVIRSPCFKKHNTEIKCRLFVEPTDQEIETEEKKWDEHMEKIRVTLEDVPKLKKKHPNGGDGSYSCPICPGTVLYSIAALNGHIHLKCSTEGCTHIME